ncbi:MAG: RidA family protein [Rhodospirillaceae bacterium]|jgi:2-iminobutanoate/2-iminopropanoate deaminase|nr:RidA family protein [Rhodospirillaceae bacterium]
MVEREYHSGTWQRDRSFSPAVTTKGGTMVWVAGHGAPIDDKGNSLAGNFAAQARQCFKNMQVTLERTGATLADMVTMTVFITDSRFGDEFVQIRNEFFEQNKWPASAMITCDGLAKPAMMVEIQGIAVVED